jgi:hypothetical protein
LGKPDLEEFNHLKEEDLVLLAKHLKIDFKVSMRKQTIKNLVIDKLVDTNIFGEEILELKVESVDVLKLKQLELDHVFKIKQLELEKQERDRKAEIEKQELEIKKMEMLEKEKQADLEFKTKMALAELEMKEKFEMEKLKMGIVQAESNTKSGSQSEHFDAAKNIRLVPKFSEKAVDKYFPQFEKIAQNLKWPKPYWSTMLQSCFVGKAAEVYSALSSEQSSDYDIAKKEILKAYELVPEAYRQKFRAYKKYESQTYVEFAKEKEYFFDKWLTSKKVEKHFDKLRQLLLLEEFKQCVHVDLKTHLDDKNVDTLQDAAVVSDNYTITHKKTFKGPSSVNSVSFSTFKNQSTDSSVKRSDFHN